MKPQYAGRRVGAVPLNLTLERELVEWLAERAPGKLRGRYLSRLIYQEMARVAERERLMAEKDMRQVVVE
jgi:hypothetical protein